MNRNNFSPLALLGKIEKGVCYAALVFLVIIAASEAAARLFGSSIPASNGLLTHFLLLLGLFSGMFTARTGDHLSIVLFQFVKNEKVRRIFSLATGLFSVVICTLLAWSSVSFVKLGLQPRLIGFIPNIVFALAMPLAFGVMTLRFGLKLPVFKTKAGFLFPLAVIAGTVLSLPVIAKIIWGFDPPDSVYNLIEIFFTVLYTVKLPLIILFIALAIMGAPIFTVISGITLVIIQSAGGEAEAVNNSIFSALTDLNIIAIPLFTLMGFFLSESRAGHRLVHSFRSVFSWIPGGMIIATVIICAFFTSFTGASGVTILALGGVLFTVLSEESSYPDRFSIGLLTSAGCIGLMFPPSLPIILAGATTRTNIIHMFMGAIIPGVILVIAMIIIGVTASVKVKIPVEPFHLRKALSSLNESILEILLPFLLIAGYFTGLFSLIEIGAISAVYVFIAEVLIHKEIKLADVKKVFFKAMPIIGGILCIIAAAKALSYAIVDTQAPENFANWLRGAIESKYVFLLLLNIALLAVGCFMDIFSAILVVLPLITPLGAAYGIDPVHLGIIFILNLEVGFLTPPVGLNLFLASYRFGKPFTKVCRYVLPFLIVQLIVVFLVTYIPALSTFLPGFF
ncbi:MAG: TRAP transporter large permease subunit [Treponema sp.]|jgi:tripartite ATP-independent transporter DctM subunit|nr:TRAP transporter large permease subunit [Treponema sp.]